MTLYSLHARRLSSLFRRRHFRTFFARASSARVYLRLRGLRAPSPCRMRSPEAPPSTKYFTPAIGHRRRRSSITTSDVPLPLPLLCDKPVVTKATPVGGGTEAERASETKDIRSLRSAVRQAEIRRLPEEISTINDKYLPRENVVTNRSSN